MLECWSAANFFASKNELESQDRLLEFPNKNRKEFATDDKAEIRRSILQLQ